MKTNSIAKLKLIANDIRQDIIRMTATAGSGHPGGALGLADIFAALYFNILKHNPQKPNWPQRDFLILSNGHVCPVLYSSLARAGYFPVKKLQTLRRLGSPLQGHPHRGTLPGVENTSGPLGQGLGQAVGLALALKLDKKANKVFVMMSDGEQDCGSIWEAAMAANKYKLKNLIGIVDYNGIQLSGKTKDIMPLGSLRKKYESFGWKVLEIDGHNFEEILGAFAKAKKMNGPIVIIARTVLGKGVSFMENKYEWHGKAPDKELAAKALKELSAIK
ncbi:MAG: transketolase [Patescibacteria group bacterium]|nr:transketolase [Patescibacteria group bacterium]MDD5490933.1 transketolase [Patescibacteria group bacterium]